MSEIFEPKNIIVTGGCGFIGRDVYKRQELLPHYRYASVGLGFKYAFGIRCSLTVE